MVEVLQPVSWNTSATISTVLHLLIKKMANAVTLRRDLYVPVFLFYLQFLVV